MAAKNPYLSDYTYLGEPISLIKETEVDYNDPYVSKIGGRPAWITINEMELAFLQIEESKKRLMSEEELQQFRKSMVPDRPTNKTLSCKNCKAKLYLVAQAYANLGPNDRFLYVFGCNNTQCSSKSNSWVALRCQFEIDDSLIKKTVSQSTSTTTHSESSEPIVKIDEYQVEKIQSDEEEEEDQEESNNAQEEHDSEKQSKEDQEDQELRELLKNSQINNKAPSKKKKKKKPKNVVPITNKQSPQILPKNTLPCYSLDIFEEPDDDLKDILTKEQSHEFKLFQEYQKKQSTYDQLDQAQSSAENDDAMMEEYNDDEMEEFSNQMLERNFKTSGGDGGGEIYEETKLKDFTTTLLRFSSILQRCPHQSIRWQFGGQPLWCSTKQEHLPPTWPKPIKQDPNSKIQIVRNFDHDGDEDDEDDDEDESIRRVNVSQFVPKCENCGASRVFELQIMPTVVYQLKCSEYANIALQGNEGMDFGCVTIFTCVNQCSTFSNESKLRYFKEYVHVQPPI
ncbi:hypothetical protein AKO1_014042 [Acrasis kona]|uniref:Programmed cell death protein 2 C-terminal domain-containing protein n=1 Tax=Acrasis kona TaxID=1008807 RepID=A0AAW2Z216_9EUKA